MHVIQNIFCSLLVKRLVVISTLWRVDAGRTSIFTLTGLKQLPCGFGQVLEDFNSLFTNAYSSFKCIINKDACFLGVFVIICWKPAYIKSVTHHMEWEKTYQSMLSTMKSSRENIIVIIMVFQILLYAIWNCKPQSFCLELQRRQV